MKNHWKVAVLVSLALGLNARSPALLAESTGDAESDDFLKLIDGLQPTPSEPAKPEASQSQSASPETAQPASSEPATADQSGADAAVDAVASPAPAQPEAQTAESSETKARPRSSAIEEIIVTAQRREESVQDVPISITVFNQEQITNANITNSSDLARYTPSLSANTRFGPENASFTIRGFTQDLRTTASVGTYFADVVAPRGQSSQTSGDGAGPGSLFDLQNVQVLKGPQGTLFGRNTTGGAILIVPQKPTDEFGGYAEIAGTNLDGKRAQAVINAPVNDSFRVRLGVDHNERDGTLNNITGIGANDLGNVNYTAGRLSFVWDVTDSIENYSIITHTDSDTHGYTSRLFACNNPITNIVSNPVGALPDLNALVAGLAGGTIDPLALIGGVSPFALLTVLSCQQQLADQKASGQDGFYDIVSAIKTPVTKIKERRFINTTTWTLTDNLTFKNILAFAHLQTDNGSNVFGTFFPDPTDTTGKREFSVGASVVEPGVHVTSQQTWVEEMQLQGNALDSRLIWQGGLYYEHSTPDGVSGNNAASFLYCDLGTVEGDPSGYNCFDPLGGTLGGVLVQKFKTEYLNKAVYSQATYNIADPFSVTLGLRYTWDKTSGVGRKDLYKYLLTVQQAPVTTITRPEVESRAPTGMLEFNYHPLDDLMTYLKYTRGYRQGSVNLAADAGLDTHDPEHVDTYEVGMKTSFDGPVPGRFNIALFTNNLTNMQLQGGYISTTSGPTTAIFNAGRAKSQGLEVEAFVQPFDFLSASFSYSLLDTKLLKSEDFCSRVQQVGFLEGTSCTPIADVGDELPFAPDKSYVANLTWTLPIPEDYGRVDLGTTYAYTGKQRAAASSSTPYDVLDDFGILNFNLSWSGIYGTGFDMSLFANNVTDEKYLTYVSGTYTVLGLEAGAPGTPRIYGARLKYNF
jgi:outer membrane receptor protein involved in Fe transport